MGETNNWKMVYDSQGEDLSFVAGKRGMPDDALVSENFCKVFGFDTWRSKKLKS